MGVHIGLGNSQSWLRRTDVIHLRRAQTSSVNMTSYVRWNIFLLKLTSSSQFPLKDTIAKPLESGYRPQRSYGEAFQGCHEQDLACDHLRNKMTTPRTKQSETGVQSSRAIFLRLKNHPSRLARKQAGIAVGTSDWDWTLKGSAWEVGVGRSKLKGI